MEASYCNAVNNHFCSSPSKPKTKYYYSSIIPSSSSPTTTIIHTQKPKLLCFPLYSWSSRPQRSVTAIGCSKGGGPVNEIERELEDEWVGMSGRWKDKCEKGGGIVELMECLEREAIMGEDEGREPTDYNRRARIFDKSARVFQAHKESTTPNKSQSS